MCLSHHSSSRTPHPSLISRLLSLLLYRKSCSCLNAPGNTHVNMYQTSLINWCSGTVFRPQKRFMILPLYGFRLVVSKHISVNHTKLFTSHILHADDESEWINWNLGYQYRILWQILPLKMSWQPNHKLTHLFLTHWTLCDDIPGHWGREGGEITLF